MAVGANFAVGKTSHKTTVMARILTILLMLVVLDCGTSCASYEPVRTHGNTNTSAYFSVNIATKSQNGYRWNKDRARICESVAKLATVTATWLFCNTLFIFSFEKRTSCGKRGALIWELES